MAVDQSYAVIFDKSSDLTMLYTNPKYDKSDEILNAMGYKAKVTEGGGKSGGAAGSSGSGGSTGTKDSGKSMDSPSRSDEAQPIKK